MHEVVQLTMVKQNATGVWKDAIVAVATCGWNDVGCEMVVDGKKMIVSGFGERLRKNVSETCSVRRQREIGEKHLL